MSSDKSKEPRPKFFKLVPKASSSDICTCNSDEISTSPNPSLDQLIRSLINIWEPVRNLSSVSQNSSFSCFSEKKVIFNSSPFISSHISQKSKTAVHHPKRDKNYQSSTTLTLNSIDNMIEKGEASDGLEEGEIVESSEEDILEASENDFQNEVEAKISTDLKNSNEDTIHSILSKYHSSEDEDFSEGDLIINNQLDLNICDTVHHYFDSEITPESTGNVLIEDQKKHDIKQESSQTDFLNKTCSNEFKDIDLSDIEKDDNSISNNFTNTTPENCHTQNNSVSNSFESKENTSIISIGLQVVSEPPSDKNNFNTNKRSRDSAFDLSESIPYSEPEHCSKKMLLSDPNSSNATIHTQLETSSQSQVSSQVNENSSQNNNQNLDVPVDLTELSSSDCELVSVIYVVDD